METHNQQFQQEQIARSEEIRATLERTFAIAYEQEAVQVDELGNWRYEDQTHSLVYDPEDQSFWIESAGHLNVRWNAGRFDSDLSGIITDEQLSECQELKQWLDSQGVPQEVSFDYSAEVSQAKLASFSTAERLFEFYADQGASAYRASEESTEQCYRLAVDDLIYIVSRDDRTGEYGIQREGTALEATTDDEQTWSEISYWLMVQETSSGSILEVSSGDTYWDQQQQRADQILPIASRVFAFHQANESLEFAPDFQSYVVQTDREGYIIGYRPDIDELWIANQREEVLATSIDRPATYDSVSQSWTLEGLGKSSLLSDRDVLEFQLLDHWLNAKDWMAGQERNLPVAQNLIANPNKQANSQNLLSEVGQESSKRDRKLLNKSPSSQRKQNGSQLSL